MHRLPVQVWPLLVGMLMALCTPALAAEVAASKSEVTFHISHPAKEYDARLLPGGAKIIATFDPQDLRMTGFDVSIQVDKFNSDNTRRDSHMIETMEALIFPTIDWKVTKIAVDAGPVKPGSYKGFASGPLTVHGVTQILEAPITMSIAPSGEDTVNSEFSVSLESFEIERPTLVFVPIKDDVPIKVMVVFPATSDIFPAAEATQTPAPATEAAPEDPPSEGTAPTSDLP